LEQEADRIADQVMAAPTQSTIERAPLQIQRFAGLAADEADTAPASVDRVLTGLGRPLEPAVREDMEHRFGHDFSHVRVHAGGAAEQSAKDVNAQAYTVGHNIVFGAGLFAPTTHAGQRLLAHELTHVVQQGTSVPRLARSPDDKEAAAIGSGIEPLELKEWQRTLESQGYEVFTRTQFDRVDWLAKAFSDRRARPDLVAVNRTKRHVLVGDVTAGPWSQAALKPGDVQKLPRNIGAETETKPHLEKTVENARQAHKQLPEELRGFSVTAQDRWWKEGKLSREITIAKGTPAPKPTGGVPPNTTSLGGVGGGRSTPTTAAPTVTTKGKAETGARLEPVVEATPGFKPTTGAAIGGAVQMLQAKQFGNLQHAEVAKYEKRLAELQPKIDAFLSGDYSVELILIVEKPNSPDVLCAAGVFCDQSQLIYYHDLYIKSVESVKPITSPSPRDTSHSSMSAARAHFIPGVHKGGPKYDINDKEIRSLPTKYPNYHCEYATHTLTPQVSISPIETRRPPASPEKPKPQLNFAAKTALAAAPARVYLMSENIVQYRTAAEVMKKLTGNPMFGEVKEAMGGLGRKRTIVSYPSDLDKPKAEALAEIVRAVGVSMVYAEINGSGDGDPGVLTIWLGRDAEK
jgi:Domain of unknown function (DUF4157)